VAERETLRSQRAAVLQALVRRLAEADPEEALAHARAWVAADPLAESAHVAVVEGLGRLGRTREALRQYDTCRQILEQELGARPSAALEQARMALGRAPARGPAPAPATPAAPRASAPLVGRAPEREALRAAVEAAAAARPGGLVLVTGEAGIGKTRLLEVLEGEVAARGGRVLRGRAFEAEAVRPYGAWIDALRAAPIGEADLALRDDLAPLLPELGAAPEGDRNRLFEAVVRLLRRLGDQAPPLAVVIDDLHWLDEASVALLHYVARALAGSRVLLAAAARTEMLPDNRPALRLVRGRQREGAVLEVPVGPLTAEQTAWLVRALAPDVDERRVVAESGGHPLFAVEMARALESGGTALSDSLAGLIADRLARLDEPAGEILPWMAALGRGFDLDLVARASQAAPTTLLAAVESLQRHGVLAAGAGENAAGYDFVHDLVREAAYRRLSAPARRLVHGRIARVLQSRPDPDGTVAGDLARHAHLAGEHELCARACLRAGERCLRLFAFGEATALSDRGRGHARELPAVPGLGLQVALLRLRVHSALQEDEGARVEAALLDLVQQAERAQLPEVAQSALDGVTFVHWYTGDLSGAHENALRQAAMARGSDSAGAARGLAATARCLAHLERDLTRAEALLAEVDATPAASELMDAVWARGLLLRHQGRYDEAVPWLERALVLGRRAQDRYCEWDCQARLAMIELERGRPQAALERCLGLAPLVERLSEGSEPALSAALEALARCALGREGAPAALERALIALRQLDSKWALAYVQTLAAGQDLAQGRPHLARARAEEARAAAEAVKRKSEAALARAVLTRVALAEGDPATALRHGQAVRDDLASPPTLSARARAAWEPLAQELGAIPTPATTVVPTERA
jgi:tetratricopeptide (TPR) repeat protein/energy-coupling factor transporter ATP-binding protein EcfA2